MEEPPPWIIRLALALVLGGAVGLLVGRARRNLALHRPATSSSARFGEAAGLVNGVLEWGNYALHTQHDQHLHGAWAMVDLQGTYRIDEVRVFGRGDGYLGEQGIGNTVSLSLDGKTWKPAGTCDVLVTQVTPCHVRPGGTPARYVRVEHPDCLVLSEIEVYGAR
jgi:hypothetical protein